MRYLLLLFLIFFAGCQKSTTPDALTRWPGPTPVLVFGDSLSAGYGIGPNKEWPVLLEQRLHELYWIRPDQSVANFSKSGETTEGGLARFQDALAEANPRVVILELGSNDALRRGSMDTMKKNLETMIDICQRQNIDVLLVGTDLPRKMFFIDTDHFTSVFKDIAKDKNVVLVPNLLAGVNNKQSLMQQDMMHPNEHGQMPMLENINDGFDELLSDLH